MKKETAHLGMRTVSCWLWATL